MTSLHAPMAPMLEALTQGEGYALGPAFSPAEWVEVKEMIHHAWLKRLSAVCPEQASLFEDLPVERYHEISEQLDHAALWTKDARLFKPEEVARLQNMSLFRQLEEALGAIEIADIEGLGYPEVYWRLVRPGAVEDVAGVHADAWFYTYTNGLPAEAQKALVKVWVAIHVEPGRSGLAVVPGSQRGTWPHHAEVRHGRPKPVFDGDERELQLEPLPTAPGQAVAFHIHLLHRGIAHTHGASRISIEFALRLTGAPLPSLPL